MTQPQLLHVNLGVTGMTCTSCSSRVERKLNKLDGAEATVNFATESASVSYDPEKLSPADLIQTVENTGYGAFQMGNSDTSDSTADAEGETSAVDAAREREADELKRRLIISAILAVPVMLISMIPALQFMHWQWAVLTMATLVYVIGGAPFHKATLTNLKHGAFTMDTLISMGTTAAYLWSLWALFIGNAGMPGMKMEMHLFASDSTMDEIYLESVAVVIAFLLLGRWFETRAKGRSSEAFRALLTLSLIHI